MQAPRSEILDWLRSQPGGMAALMDAIDRKLVSFTVSGRVVFISESKTTRRCGVDEWMKKELEGENCPECGSSVTITTSRTKGFYDGDEFRCDECELGGIMSIDEESCLALWDNPTPPTRDEKPPPVS